MLSSLRFRTAAAYILLIVAAFALLGLLIADRLEKDLRRTIADDIESQARMVESVAQPLFTAGASVGDFQALARQLADGTNSRVTIIAVDGTVLGDSEAEPSATDNHAGRPEVIQALAGGVGESTRRSSTVSRELTYVAVPVADGANVLGVVRVARSSSTVDQTLSHVTRSVLLIVALTAGLAAVLSLLLGASVLRPLGRLAEAASNLAQGRLSERISPRPSGEIGQLADSFNRMAAGLESMVEETAQGRNRMIAVLNSATDAVLAIDHQGRIAFANLAAERMFGRPTQELIGDPLGWKLPNEQVLDAVRASTEDGRRSIVEMKRGNELFQVTVSPIISGGEWTALVSFHDVTEVRRAEQIRRDFVANVSHEFRTPLAAIRSVIETLENGAMADPSAAREFFAQANFEIERLTNMVQDLMELSRIESGEIPLRREHIDLGLITERAVGRLTSPGGANLPRVEVELEPRLPPVVADPERLERAIVNLVHNAIKFTPSEGVIHVSVRSAGGAVHVDVSDNGIGISPSELPRVFERFYKAGGGRRSGEGTGLGLAIVKHTIEAHRGRVHAESEEGRGSSFGFEIPVAV
jgi:two-component system phosphate regulon sensor histidine kinase PhoR